MSTDSQVALLQELLAKEKQLRVEERKGRIAAETKLRDVQIASFNGGFLFQPIGHIRSIFLDRRGTPRQGNLNSALARLEFCSGVPLGQAVEGLEEFSHVWLLFVFDRNTNLGKVQESAAKGSRVFDNVKWKVCPPRLNGLKKGVFATRSPHRPNPIGLTLAKLEEIDLISNPPALLLSGVDLLDHTSVLDIKPFVPDYDGKCIENPRFAPWIHQKPNFERIFISKDVYAVLCNCKFVHFKNVNSFLQALNEILVNDIRSIHRQNLNRNCEINAHPILMNADDCVRSSSPAVFDSDSTSFCMETSILSEKKSFVYEDVFGIPPAIRFLEPQSKNEEKGNFLPLTDPASFLVRLDSLTLFYITEYEPIPQIIVYYAEEGIIGSS